MEISKETSRVMKGYAILFIVLHNYLHLQGFVKENEMTFIHDKSALFFSHLSNPSWNLFGDFFSFLGWIGVPVFVFVSGYGLVKKYKHEETLGFKPFLRHSWLKIFLLMLPGVFVFIIFYALLGKWTEVINSVYVLSLFNNIIHIVPFEPGIYWYFGFAFELYIVFFICRKYVNNKRALLLTVASLILQAVIGPYLLPDQKLLLWVKLNFIGWLPVFLLGMLCAEGRGEFLTIRSPQIAVLYMLITLAFSIFFNANFFFWLLIPFTAVYFFYSIAVLSEGVKPMHIIGGWLGKYSSCIFVVHPIARFLVGTNHLSLPPVGSFFLYLVLTILGAILYKVLYDYLLKKCNV